MQLKATILEVKEKENTRYDTITGDPDPSYYLEATVIDFSVKEPQRYHCTFRDIPEVDQLRQAYKDKWPI
jgi:hypothetical protein